MSILHEIPFYDGKVIIEGEISYVEKIPFIFPFTIKMNIILSSPFNENKYKNILNICNLTEYINTLAKLDNSIVGSQGIFLSMDNRIKIGLARALYKDSDIFLIDNFSQFVDPKLFNEIFYQIMLLLEKKTIILSIHEPTSNLLKSTFLLI